MNTDEKFYPCTCDIRRCAERRDDAIETLVRSGMMYGEAMDKVGYPNYPPAIKRPVKCPSCEAAGMYTKEQSK